MNPESTYKINLNGTGLEKLLIPEFYLFENSKAIERLNQSEDSSYHYHVFLYLAGFPIGFCILFLDKDFFDHEEYEYFNFYIDYVYIKDDFRGQGYSVVLCEKIMEIIIELSRKNKKSKYTDNSDFVSDGGYYFCLKLSEMLAERGIVSW